MHPLTFPFPPPFPHHPPSSRRLISSDQSRFSPLCRPLDHYSAKPMARSRVGSALTFHLNKASCASCSWPVRFEYQCLTRKHSAAPGFCPNSEGDTIPRSESCDNRPCLGYQPVNCASRGSLEDLEVLWLDRCSR